MSEHSTPEERTEMPTDKRMGQIRQEGQVYSSTDVSQTASLVTGFVVLYFLAGSIFSDMELLMRKSFEAIADPEPWTTRTLYEGSLGVARLVGPNILIITLIIGFISAMTTLLQTKFNMREKILKFQWSSLNPITGIKRIFSVHGITNLVKALAKLALILPIGYLALASMAPEMVQLIHVSVEDVLEYMAKAMFYIFWQIAVILVVLAIIDWVWGYFQWLKKNKMTKQEVKDERKSLEGDEETKRKIASKGLSRIMQRIQDSVKQADVVITNPTHYAIALKYDRENMMAPSVVAKGKGFLALRIRELARESSIPVVERKPLARALYASVEVGSEIPRELFKAVAEVLAYVYKLRNPNTHATEGGAR